MSKKQQIIPRILDHAPNTAMILGAALSGGNAIELAKMLCQPDGKDNEDEKKSKQES